MHGKEKMKDSLRDLCVLPYVPLFLLKEENNGPESDSR